ncbi:MAG: hypothetical protein PHN31_05995 [Candidatus Gracilibacteria bacterium]|nr:hypothetical protein [Candidatus Gracilibacteria bacterium]
MILYIEKDVLDYPQTEKIISLFPSASKVWIKNYKNIFDKSIPLHQEKSLIIAKSRGSAIGKTPDNYGHTPNTYFFKTSLNCVFDCAYCYLKGAFKNDMQVYFVNYEDIKREITNLVISSGVERSFEETNNETRKNNVISKEQISPLQSKGQIFNTINKNGKIHFKDPETSSGGQSPNIGCQEKNSTLWFYSSDYSDILGSNKISGFLSEFVPFFEKFEGVMMEVRSKSTNIKDILDLGFVPKNTEFAFSLNPQILIEKYEKGTPNLDDRIETINKLINLGYKVGLRFLPLLPIKDYKNIYGEFVAYIKERIDLEKVHSSFASGLLYTKEDYNEILKKYPRLDILYRLKQENDNFVRCDRDARDFFYNLFHDLDENCMICMDD